MLHQISDASAGWLPNLYASVAPCDCRELLHLHTLKRPLSRMRISG